MSKNFEVFINISEHCKYFVIKTLDPLIFLQRDDFLFVLEKNKLVGFKPKILSLEL